MRKFVFIILLISVSCLKNINTDQKPDQKGKTVTVNIEFTSDLHFCELQQSLSEKLKLENYDAEFEIEGISVTQLNFEFNENNLKEAGISFNDITGDFIAFIRKEYPGISVKITEKSILIEYSVCTRLNYTNLRSYSYRNVPVTQLASLKVKYVTPAENSSQPLIKLKITFRESPLGEKEIVSRIRKQIVEFENETGFLFTYVIK
ncbi:MAG: hypothetical protein JW982_13290 [Spirochaetes bacterium]|nr:hypothetical protein [Spirochaetota bacterium]